MMAFRFRTSVLLGLVASAGATYVCLSLNPGLPRLSAQDANVPAPTAGARPNEVPKAAGETPDTWECPDDTPHWLAMGEAAAKRISNVASLLELEISGQYGTKPLEKMLAELSPKVGRIAINRHRLEALGVNVETPVTLNLAGEYTVRSALQTILDPLNCTWAVTESGLVVTSRNDVLCMMLQQYDLSYVLPNATHVESVMNALQQSCSPDSWLSNGGNCTMVNLGPSLLVFAPEPLHREIQIALYRISQINRANILTTPPPSAAIPVVGGMGGGFGGGFGGGTGGGFGGGFGGGMGGGY